MIESFKDRDTRKIWEEVFVKKYPKDIQRICLRKMIMIHRSKNINDLRVPPGNRLELLTGDRKGVYSIRINEQWRICFRWTDGAAHDVEITDYH